MFVYIHQHVAKERASNSGNTRKKILLKTFAIKLANTQNHTTHVWIHAYTYILALLKCVKLLYTYIHSFIQICDRACKNRVYLHTNFSLSLEI